MKKDSMPLFNEIDERDASLFVTLTYPNEVQPGDEVINDASTVVLRDFDQQVAFVAIKNGMHSGKGYAFFSPNVSSVIPDKAVHVASLFNLTLSAVT